MFSIPLITMITLYDVAMIHNGDFIDSTATIASCHITEGDNPNNPNNPIT